MCARRSRRPLGAASPPRRPRPRGPSRCWISPIRWRSRRPPPGLLGELADLFGHDREAPALLAGAGGLDRGVEREQVGLLRDAGDGLDDVPMRSERSASPRMASVTVGVAGDLAHRAGATACGLDSLVGDRTGPLGRLAVSRADSALSEAIGPPAARPRGPPRPSAPGARRPGRRRRPRQRSRDGSARFVAGPGHLLRRGRHGGGVLGDLADELAEAGAHRGVARDALAGLLEHLVEHLGGLAELVGALDLDRLGHRVTWGEVTLAAASRPAARLLRSASLKLWRRSRRRWTGRVTERVTQNSGDAGESQAARRGEQDGAGGGEGRGRRRRGRAGLLGEGDPLVEVADQRDQRLDLLLQDRVRGGVVALALVSGRPSPPPPCTPPSSAWRSRRASDPSRSRTGRLVLAQRPSA